MTEAKKYKCVHCGEGTGALYRTYGPTVLKLTKCEKCQNIVDKYIEYDPVIVIIDLVLMSKEAQRHVIYNTEFKSYWKLFIILIMLETYGLWRNDSLFNIVVNSVCNIQTNTTINTTYISLPVQILLPESIQRQCDGWVPEEREIDNDLFIWEKDFYIQFMSTFIGIVMFITTIHSLMRFLNLFPVRHQASIERVVKSFSLANMSILFTIPMLVWGNADTTPYTRTVHYLLVFVYSFVMFYNVFTVLYESPMLATVLILAMSCCFKYMTTFHVTPYLRKLVT